IEQSLGEDEADEDPAPDRLLPARTVTQRVVQVVHRRGSSTARTGAGRAVDIAAARAHDGHGDSPVGSERNQSSPGQSLTSTASRKAATTWGRIIRSGQL